MKSDTNYIIFQTSYKRRIPMIYSKNCKKNANKTKNAFLKKQKQKLQTNKNHNTFQARKYIIRLLKIRKYWKKRKKVELKIQNT